MKLACESLDRSLREIIAASDIAGWSEKLLLTRVWLATCDLDGDNAVRTLRNSIDSFSEIIGDGVSKTGSHAAQAVWRASSLRTLSLTGIVIVEVRRERVRTQSIFDRRAMVLHSTT